MRSDKFYVAMEAGASRFAMCNMLAKGLRATHKNGTPIQDSINRVMEMIVVPVPVPVPVIVK